MAKKMAKKKKTLRSKRKKATVKPLKKFLIKASAKKVKKKSIKKFQPDKKQKTKNRKTRQNLSKKKFGRARKKFRRVKKKTAKLIKKPYKAEKTIQLKLKTKKLSQLKNRRTKESKNKRTKVFKSKKTKERSNKKTKILKNKGKDTKKIRTIKPKSNFFISPQNFFKAKIKVIGVGGGGGSIVSEIGRSLGKASFVIADTDLRIFQKHRGVKYFLFGQQVTHGLGAGLNPELAKAAAEQEKEKIEQIFESQNIVILVACLGGGVGSGASQIFAEVSKKFNCITFGIFTLPFKFEGKAKHRIALKSLSQLRKFLNVSITIPNERIFKIIDENTSITEAFSLVNKNLIKSLDSLIDLIYNPGIINIDFADLRTILQGKGNLAFLNTVEASGKGAPDKIIEDILKNPLYQNNNFKAEKILFNIAGGKNLSMVEVDKISRKIAEQNPKAKIIFGISRNPKYKSKVKTTLLMTGPSTLSHSDKELREKKNPPEKTIVKTGKTKKGIKQRKKIPLIPKESQGSVPLPENLLPVFNNVPVGFEAKLDVFSTDNQPKKAIRRTALEIKKAQEIEESKKSKQEEEWEIPAFLRFKK